jgi:hypothetical protein
MCSLYWYASGRFTDFYGYPAFKHLPGASWFAPNENITAQRMLLFTAPSEHKICDLIENGAFAFNCTGYIAARKISLRFGSWSARCVSAKPKMRLGSSFT